MKQHDDPLDGLLATLVRLRERCGAALYLRAVAAARAAVGRVVLAEAERLSGVRRPAGTVIRLPLARQNPRDES